MIAHFFCSYFLSPVSRSSHRRQTLCSEGMYVRRQPVSGWGLIAMVTPVSSLSLYFLVKYCMIFVTLYQPV